MRSVPPRTVHCRPVQVSPPSPPRCRAAIHRTAAILEIDGVHRGKRLHLAPDPLLTTRGFRWINEAPFNR